VSSERRPILQGGCRFASSARGLECLPGETNITRRALTRLYVLGCCVKSCLGISSL
jgi:hypothetical protein